MSEIDELATTEQWLGLKIAPTEFWTVVTGSGIAKSKFGDGTSHYVVGAVKTTTGAGELDKEYRIKVNAFSASFLKQKGVKELKELVGRSVHFVIAQPTGMRCLIIDKMKG